MPSTARLIAKNSIYVFAGNFFSSFVLFVSNIYIARHLKESLFGSYSLVIEFVSLFAMLASFGIDTILLREISQPQKQSVELITTAFSLKLFFSGVSIVAAVALIWLLPYGFPVRLGVTIFSFTLFFNALVLLFTTILQARLRLLPTLVASVVSKLLFAVLVALLILLNWGFVSLILALSISFVFQSLMLLRAVRRYWTPRVSWYSHHVKMFLRESWPLAVALSFAAIYNRIDVVLLSLLKEQAQVGFYSAAYMISGALSLIPFAFLSIMFPLFSRYVGRKKSAFVRSTRLSFKYLLITGIFVTILLWSSADSIILLLFGQSYAPSARALSVLSWSLIFIFLNYLFVNLLAVQKKQKVTMFIVGIGVLVSIIANLIVIPKYGFVGAAAVAVATAACNFVFFLFYLGRSNRFVSFSVLLRILLVAVLALVTVTYVHLHWILVIIIATAVYWASLLILRVIDRDDISLLKELLPKSKPA